MTFRAFAFGVPRGEGLEDVNFAGDVEVVNAVAETGVHYRARRRRKRTGAHEHRRNILERSINPGRVAKIKRPSFKVERLCDRIDFTEIASG